MRKKGVAWLWAFLISAVVTGISGFSFWHVGYESGYNDGYRQRDGEAVLEIIDAKKSSYERGYNAGYEAGTTTDRPKTSSSFTDQYKQSVTVYITDNGMKYHKQGCQYLRDSRSALSMADAEAQGYTPCSECW